MKKIQYKAASIIWKSDVIPFSNQFQDPYFSVDGGLAESQYVFIKGNDLYDRLIDGFKIAELGFGTGLNLLSVIRLWASLGRPGKLNFTSFEAFPVKPAVMRRALKNFPDLINLSNYQCDILERGATHFEIKNISVRFIHLQIFDMRNSYAVDHQELPCIDWNHKHDCNEEHQLHWQQERYENPP